MGGLSIWHWLIVLLVVVLIFGTKKLRNIGGDVGGAVKNFKDAMNDEKAVAEATILNTVKEATPPLIEGKVVEVPAAAAPKKRAPAKKAATTAKPAAAKAKTTTAKPKAEATKKPAAKKPAAKKAPAKPKATETA